MNKFIEALRSHLHHDHPECLTHYFHNATTPEAAIDRYRCGYQLSLFQSEIPYIPGQMVLFCEDLSPLYPVALFLPLTEAQYEAMQDFPVLSGEAFEIRVSTLATYNTGETPESSLPYIGIYASLDADTSLPAYIQLVDRMQKEMAKLLTSRFVPVYQSDAIPGGVPL